MPAQVDEMLRVIVVVQEQPRQIEESREARPAKLDMQRPAGRGSVFASRLTADASSNSVMCTDFHFKRAGHGGFAVV